MASSRTLSQISSSELTFTSTAQKIDDLLFWDVLNGITRRAWAGNDNATWASHEAAKREPRYVPTEPTFVDAKILENI